MMRRTLTCILFLMPFLFLKAQSINGTYTTDFNELILQQNGNQVTGTYKHSGGRVEGTLNGRTLTGWWYQTNGKGRLVFEFSSDFSSFAGKWSYNDAEPTSKWNGKKIINPTELPTSQIAGVYETDFNELTLQQNGNQVTGTYKHSGGRIEGTLIGRTLTGWWYQTNGKGRLVFEFASDFSSFTGKWGYNDAEPTSRWDGKKINP